MDVGVVELYNGVVELGVFWPDDFDEQDVTVK